MKEDYLWDKSGEPDPQIQQLEEILGTLRYQPTPLEIPDELPVMRRRNYLPLLAIAATVLLALIAAGLWMRIRSNRQPAPEQVRTVLPTTPPQTPPAPGSEFAARSNEKPFRDSIKPVAEKPRTKVTTPGLGKRERQEALEAKEQLMLALRVTSEKLSLAQRKVQGPASPNQIRNQHKEG